MRDHKKQRNYSGGVDTEVRFTAEAQRAQRREELADGPSALAFQFECARSQGWDQEAHLRVLCVSAVRRMALVAHYLSSYEATGCPDRRSQQDAPSIARHPPVRELMANGEWLIAMK